MASKQQSLGELLDGWRCGDQAAATAIYQRYEHQLLRLASLRINPVYQRRFGPESVVLSVLDTVLRRLRSGQYDVDPTGSLWNLLAVIAERKIRKRVEHHGASKRDVRKEAHPDLPGGSDADVPYDPADSRQPTPEEAAVLADELAKIRTRLRPEDFEIFQLRLEALSCQEIAQRLGCARQTVRYKLKRILELLEQWAQDHSA